MSFFMKCITLLLSLVGIQFLFQSWAAAPAPKNKPAAKSKSDIYSLFPDQVVARGNGFEIK